MALVAYDYESGSDDEPEEEENSSEAVIIPPNQESGTTSSISSLLSDLPKSKPTQNQIQKEDKLEDFIPKYQPQKEKPPPRKVKITIPSLSQFEDEDDDDEPLHKKSKTVSARGSGLLSVLPPVKGTPLTTKSFVPHVLKKSAKSSSLVPHAVRKKAEVAKMAAINKMSKPSNSKFKSSGSDLESDDDDIQVPETFDEEMWIKVCGRPKAKEIKPKLDQVVEETAETVIDIAPEPEQPYDGLNNEAFKELVGKSKRPVNIKLVDINEDELLLEKDLWMTKALTDPEQEAKPAVENPVDPTRKKKHHITYLAEQAKANEQDFKNQWAASKHTRTQTRAKYGF